MKLYGVVVEIMYNLIVFKLELKKMFLIKKLGEDLKTKTGSTKSDKILWLYNTKRMKWPSFQIIYRRLQKILQLWNSMG